FGQKSEYTYRNPLDSSFNCYLTVLPENTSIKGLLIRDFSRLPKLPSDRSYPFKWRDLALENGFLVLYTVSSNYFPELFYDEKPLILLDDMVYEVVKKYNIPSQNIFIGGISASGTRALKYTQFCNQGKSRFGIKISGVFSVDSPLDLERFYFSALKHHKYFKKGMKSEAELVQKVFMERLGNPYENKESYTQASVYSASDNDGGNAKQLKKSSVLMFHEPDIDWWSNERGASYFDMNSFDIAGMYVYLLAQNHMDIELITTSGLGFDRNGNRNCHSWTIVDEKYLINWMVTRLK
ncbi:MAG: hypothetical protein ACPGVC_09725, partial [Salibacteraceae bacterium]